MKYTISQLNRTVELNDDLYSEYTKYDDLTEHNFIIVLVTKFGHLPSETEISDEELNNICNEVLFYDLKALSLLPKAISVMTEHRKELRKAAQAGTLLEFQLQE